MVLKPVILHLTATIGIPSFIRSSFAGWDVSERNNREMKMSLT